MLQATVARPYFRRNSCAIFALLPHLVAMMPHTYIDAWRLQLTPWLVGRFSLIAVIVVVRSTVCRIFLRGCAAFAFLAALFVCHQNSEICVTTVRFRLLPNVEK